MEIIKLAQLSVLFRIENFGFLPTNILSAAEVDGGRISRYFILINIF